MAHHAESMTPVFVPSLFRDTSKIIKYHVSRELMGDEEWEI